MPGSARPPPGQKLQRNETFTGRRLPIDAHRIFWDAETTKCWSCEMHLRMRNILLRCQWNDMKEFLHSWLNEPMNQRIDKEMSIKMPKNRWISEPMKKRSNESMNQAMNQSIKESRNQWINKATKQWTHESLNQWLNEWTNEPLEGWGDGWIVDLLFFFTLLSATSSLSSHLSGLLLLWAASQLAILQLLQPNSSLRAAGTKLL